jgi:hypothetical protein
VASLIAVRFRSFQNKTASTYVRSVRNAPIPGQRHLRNLDRFEAMHRPGRDICVDVDATVLEEGLAIRLKGRWRAGRRLCVPKTLSESMT